MSYTEAQKRASIKYLNEKTDDIRLRVKAGLKGKYQKEAEKRGMSMTKFIVSCVEKEISVFPITQKPDCYFRKFVLHFVLHRVAFPSAFPHKNLRHPKKEKTGKLSVHRHFSIFLHPFASCGQWDSNPHGCPLAPKTNASANSAMAASDGLYLFWRKLSRSI